MTQPPPKTDLRLLGHWKSDRRRTLADWKWAPRTNPKKKKFVASLFGHLKLRYTRRYVYSDYQGTKSRERYEVLGSDSHSVAISVRRSLMDEPRIYHVTFEDNGYWIPLGRGREWFRRPRKTKRAQS